MTHQNKHLDIFHEALQKEREARQKLLLENPQEEQNRLKWIEFRRIIERIWCPLIDEYLTVLGKLWFGERMRLRGPLFRKDLVACPAYVVSHEIYGPMAVFWVAEDTWGERENPFIYGEGRTEARTESFRRGYRCRVVIKDDGQYHFQSDDHNTLVQYGSDVQVSRETFVDIFAEAYLSGPDVIFCQWENASVGEAREPQVPEV